MAHIKVRLKDTNELSYADESFCVKENGKNAYYSSEESYKKMTQEKSDWKNCYEICQDILGYERKQRLPGLLLKFLKDYKDPYGYDCLYDTLMSLETSLTSCMEKKNFESDSGKAHYINRAISNHINDFYKIKKNRKKKAAVQERQLNEIVENEPQTRNTERRKDISGLLGEGSWI